MKRNDIITGLPFLILLFLSLLTATSQVLAHCDGLDGPVVKAAQKALESGNVNLALIWVQKDDEPEIRKAFQQTLEVRKLSSAARELADMYFFETLVRIHRAGEGAPYTGLKPAGRDLGPAIPAADRALENGSADPLLKLLNEAVKNGIQKHFEQLMAEKKFDPDNVEAGREFVKAYVEFVHYVERLYEAAAKPAPGHLHDSEDTAAHKEAH
ncbi:MAG: hypothetical protein HUU32_01160 [Calditrichaceae bacterium]|nr:DUF6448 family protein [Calditrichia bacterium]NUQ39983.1 hypothetical protein [Calditrichaceae bacterium]